MKKLSARKQCAVTLMFSALLVLSLQFISYAWHGTGTPDRVSSDFPSAHEGMSTLKAYSRDDWDGKSVLSIQGTIRDGCSGKIYSCEDTKHERGSWIVTLQSPRLRFAKLDAGVSYLEYAYVMLRSLIDVGTSKEILVLTASDVVEEDIDVLRSISPKIQFQPVPEILMPVKSRDTRHNNTLTKLNIFTLVQFDKVVSLDVDMLFVKNADAAFCIPAFAATKRPDKPQHRFNSGLFVARPNMEDYNALIKMLHDTPEKVKYGGEQPLLREHFSAKCLPTGYNCPAGKCGLEEQDVDKLFIVHDRFPNPGFEWKSFKTRWVKFHAEFLDKFGHILKNFPPPA